MNVMRTSSRGVYLPATAAIATVLVTIVFALGLDTGIQKLAAVRIRAVAESTCRASARELPITRNGIAVAEGILNRLLPSVKGAEVTTVSIVSATAPRVHRGAPFISSRVTLTCPDANCYFYGDVTDSRVTSLFPSSFWSNDNYGDIVACSIEAETISVMHGTRTVRQTVAWEERQIGAILPSDTHTPAHHIPNPRGFVGGGVIVLVDPTLTTQDGNDYERFPLLDVELTALDPLRNLASSLPLRHFSGRRPSYTPSLVTNFPLQEPLRSERAHACVPIVAAVRNRFLSGLVSRFRGRLRDMHAVYIANPMHRRGRAGAAYDFYPTDPNHPSVIVQGGQDYMSARFQLPYVLYRPGVDDADAQNPFVTNPNVDGAMQDRLVMGQLRDCYHMYSGAVSPGGINRTTEEGAFNTGFEFPEIEATSQMLAVAPPYEPSFSTYPWDQEPGLPEPTQRPFRSGEQVLAMLGTVQICPHGGNGGDSSLGPSCDEIGEKPPVQADVGLATNDLRGDLRGALMAINGARILPDGTTIPFHAYHAADLPGATPRVEVFTRSASLVLVLHRRLGEEEVSEIREQVAIFNSGPPSGRRILVVYFPATPYDATAFAIDRIKDAFNIDSSLYPTEDRNLLMVFAPPPSGPGSLPTEAAMKTYWMDRLRRGPLSVANGSRSAFRYLFTESPKL